MPEIGEVKRAREIGRPNYDLWIWHACQGCGKQRWVSCRKGKPRRLLCRKCSAKKKEISMRGATRWNWNGGKTRKSGGYIGIRMYPEDFFYPMAQHDNYVLEHRFIMAKHLGRCLQDWEIIHHKNHIKTDNRLENLQLVTDDRHKQISILERKIAYLEKQNAELKAKIKNG